MKKRAEELRAEGKKGAKKADGLQQLLDAIAGMGPDDRELAERLHVVMTKHAPDLQPKTWYGMPAYANEDGKAVDLLPGLGQVQVPLLDAGLPGLCQPRRRRHLADVVRPAEVDPRGGEEGRRTGQVRPLLEAQRRRSPSGTTALAYRGRMRRHVSQLLRFAWLEAQSCIFAVGIFVGLVLVRVVPLPIERYDALLIWCLVLTFGFWALGLETWREVLVIFGFHALGLALEIFKVHQGSWLYPGDATFADRRRPALLRLHVRRRRLLHLPGLASFRPARLRTTPRSRRPSSRPGSTRTSSPTTSSPTSASPSRWRWSSCSGAAGCTTRSATSATGCRWRCRSC